MKIKNLTLTNIRAFKSAEFTFQPGINLVVGVNGVGKSTVIDGLRFLLSQALGSWYGFRFRRHFSGTDIKAGSDYLNAELVFELLEQEVHYSIRLPGRKEMMIYLNHEHEFNANELERTLVVHYSPRRALISHRKIPNSKKSPAAALIDALDHRELRLQEFAEWWLAQASLAAENAPNAQRHLDALAAAVSNFVGACSNFRVLQETFTRYKNGQEVQNRTVSIMVDKAGVTLELQQLSDGERGILALVIDLARRLSIANPDLADPLQGEAVVLIDELDLHLHPKWQRSIVHKLTTTFPNCQFIATTHSPLIIGEVPPENIIILPEAGQAPFRPNQSLGMDTEWILKYIMGATTRNTETEQELLRIANLIENEEYDAATNAIDVLRDRIGDFPELVRLQTRIDRFQILGE